MNLLDEHAQVLNEVGKIHKTLKSKRCLRDASIKELQSFTPVYKDFPVLVARAKQLQKDIKDCDAVIPQLELELKVFEQRANELYKLICDQYELRKDYTTGHKVWVEPGTFQHMLDELQSVEGLSFDQMKSKLDEIEFAEYLCKKSLSDTHPYMKWKYMGRHEFGIAKNSIKDAIASQSKSTHISEKCKWFSWR